MIAPTAQAKPPRWWVRDALCVHSGLKQGVRVGNGEGPWNDPGAPYYGGMQMDAAFARTYGGWIVAHHGLPHLWHPATQLLVAYRGWRHRGWYPWPNTARICGLI